MDTWRVRHRALFAYLISAAIFTGLLYALLFYVRAEAIDQCHSDNRFRTEVNSRADSINALIRYHSKELQRGHAPFVYVQTVPLADCETRFDRPWPFGPLRR